jgi:pantothenate kinase
MTVGDIYGEKMKLLPKDIIAASLGKVKSHLCNNFKFQ